MRPDGSKVGGTSGFLQLPHSYPSSASQVAANNREIERVVNQIPIGSTSIFTGAGGELDLDDGHSTVEFDFALPGASSEFYAVTGRVYVNLSSADPDLISVWGIFGDFAGPAGWTGPNKVVPTGSQIQFPVGPALHPGGGEATIGVRWDGNTPGDVGYVSVVLLIHKTTYQP